MIKEYQALRTENIKRNRKLNIKLSIYVDFCLFLRKNMPEK
jgi:hypothetical protein